ncbi:hypothetical protein QWZ14_06745 [Paeniroseomonas aquatica]|uniref:Uncharacterized protein n=1 Tax=Paeniroseomonas aquatica TaxID=373043 RepID=A0ABT8A2W4_9PROT|nr:hypothetical protein [Paeniroseomonas aquatica]MDN3564075.1 hypothetical protein [Paeniroseomonas aquatica]
MSKTHKEIFNWNEFPETATILAIRNARHHNLANRIRGIYTYHLQQAHPEDFKEYLLVDYPESDDGGDTFDTPVSWYDLETLLSMPPTKTRLRPNVNSLISEYMMRDIFNKYPSKYSIEKQVIFFNIIPIVVNAAIKISPLIKSFVKARSLEAKTYLDLFSFMDSINTKKHIIDKIQISLPS